MEPLDVLNPANGLPERGPNRSPEYLGEDLSSPACDDEDCFLASLLPFCSPAPNLMNDITPCSGTVTINNVNNHTPATPVTKRKPRYEHMPWDTHKLKYKLSL